jgi:phosphoribosylformylglycinamidine cyclo-ligase
MPDFYRPGEYDLAGTIVGIVSRNAIIDGTSIVQGDAIVGVASDGLHTNGYSLARRVIFEQAGLGLDDALAGTGRSVVDELLQPHRSYVRPVLELRESISVKGIAHITGGGVWDNIPRVLPAGLCASLRRGTWEIPPVFDFLEKVGGIDSREMHHVFNMGLGLVLFLNAEEADEGVRLLKEAGERAWLIGEVVKGAEPVVLA